MPERNRNFLKQVGSAAIAILIVTAIITLTYLATRPSPPNKLNNVVCSGVCNSN